ncbi:MAG: DUF502 domain-containing protein [Candidatus Omnitrophica bacterium]|nr:DUF502 domain-containing protein [Candidatus Omnitrophota bacterium]
MPMILRRLKKYFFSGLAVFLPLSLAIYVCVWLLNFTESLLGKYLKPLFLEYYDFYFWGIGIVCLLVIILFCGFVVTQYFGRFLHRAAERLVLKVPLLGTIYPAFKEIADFLFRDKANQIQQVVLAEWPSPGVYILGFLTNMTSSKVSDKVGLKLLNIMIPHVPNPLTGFVVMLPENRVKFLDISVEEAMKIIVSGGVINGEASVNAKQDDDLDAP